MNTKSNYIKLYEASMITLRALQHYLDKEDIPSLIKSNFQSSNVAGFGSHMNDNSLYVYEKDRVVALKIVKTFLKES